MAVSMIEAITTLREIMEDNDLHYIFEEKKNTFTLNFSLNNSKLSTVRIIIRVIPGQKNPDVCFRITSHGLIGIKADDDCMAEMSEFLHRANYGMVFGCFEFDHDDGEIRFRVSINCIDDLPGPDTLEDLWDLPAMMMDRYGNGILSVSMGLLSPEEAIERIEG